MVTWLLVHADGHATRAGRKYIYVGSGRDLLVGELRNAGALVTVFLPMRNGSGYSCLTVCG
jgi:hypothetical protein